VSIKSREETVPGNYYADTTVKKNTARPISGAQETEREGALCNSGFGWVPCWCQTANLSFISMNSWEVIVDQFRLR
jgi:hypothetical protein